MSLVTCGSVQSRNVWNYTRLMDCIQTCSLRLHTRTICDWCWRRRSWNGANGHQCWQRSMIWRSWLHIFWTFRKNCPFPHARLTWTDLCMRQNITAKYPNCKLRLTTCLQMWASTSTITSALGQQQWRTCGRPKMFIYNNLLGCLVFASRTGIWHTAIFENHWWSRVPSKSSWQMCWWNLRRTPIVLRDCLSVSLLKKLQTRYMYWYCWRNQPKGKMGRKESFKDIRSIAFIVNITQTRPPSKQKTSWHCEACLGSNGEVYPLWAPSTGQKCFQMHIVHGLPPKQRHTAQG